MTIKDRLGERAVQWLINRKLRALGRMTTLSIDSKARIIQLKLDLKGDPAPVEVTLRDYRVVEENEATFLEFRAVETSREWMNVLLEQYVTQRRLEIPAKARLLKLVL